MRNMTLSWAILVVLVSAVSKCESARNSSACYGMSECTGTASCNARHRDANSDALKTRPVLTCGAAGEDKVCCPAVDAPERDNHRNRKLLPDDCGLAFVERIVSGEPTALGELPWMALIGVKTNSGIKFICGGSVISKRYVLTAAHCVSNASVSQVRLAEWDMRTFTDVEQISLDEFNMANITDIRASRITVHQNYSSKSLKNDIALIRLKSDIVFANNEVQPICLPFQVNDTGMREGLNYIVAGWGVTASGSTKPSDVLQKAYVQEISMDDCVHMAPLHVHFDTTDQLCATAPPASGAAQGVACKGDSGGPLMKINTDSTYVVIGIVSFGIGQCDEQGSKSVYTNVHSYLNWILDTIGE